MIRSRDQLRSHLDAGGIVRLDMIHEPEPKLIWTTERGESVHGSAAKYARAEGWLKPRRDGLFEDTSQTFEAA